MNLCVTSCERKNHEKAESTGVRAAFFYPGGGTYKGYWLRSQHHLYGVKENKHGLIYDGQWLNGKRHGNGTMRLRLPSGALERIYVGEWSNDMKCGEGKQFYKDGTYYGWWKNNRRHGMGAKWYKNGDIYLGEWQADAMHGVGVYMYANGNRYEGHFARGYKNGEGTFYHMHTGQIQKGMWQDNVCKSSIVQDEFRNQVDQPTEYPIPSCGLVDPDTFVCRAFQQYIQNAYKTHKSFKELECLNYARKSRYNTKFEPKQVSRSRFFIDPVFPCVCKHLETLISLRQRTLKL